MLPSLPMALLSRVIVVALLSVSPRALPLASANALTTPPRGTLPAPVRLSWTVPPANHCLSITPEASTPTRRKPLRLPATPDCRVVMLGVPWISRLVATTSALIGSLVAPVRPLAEAFKVNESPSPEARYTRPVKVATPLMKLAVRTPVLPAWSRLPAPATSSVTSPVAVLSTLPLASTA